MSEPNPPSPKHFAWLDTLRGVAILWIFLVHFVERFLCCPAFANPNAAWPELAARIDQVMPMAGSGFAGLFANALRYVGWLGDQGVQLFLVASGFGLTYAALQRAERPQPVAFLRRRLAKVLPQYWVAHLVFVFTFVVMARGFSPLDWRTFASFFGLRFLPSVMYHFAPAWWFIGLILQFYVVFPWLYRLVEGSRGIRNVLLLIGTGIAVRTAGLLVFEAYNVPLIDWWSRGAVFVTRLPDFGAGMLFALLLCRRESLFRQLTSGAGSITLWVAVWLLGNVASFFLLGMGVAFFLTAISLFAIVYMVAGKRETNERRRVAPVTWMGRNSYSFFLMHHPVIAFIVPATLSPFMPGRVLALLAVSLAVAVALGVALQALTDWLLTRETRWYRAGGLWRPIWRTLALGGVAGLAVLGVELGVRTVAPQEVMGWGERESLVPDDMFGYKLKPGATTRLRWLSYDYEVTANELGFPGPLYPPEKPAGTTRIFVTGDAFESAEGVDTDEAWPRLVEDELGRRGVDAQVLNFSITGWGPRQYDLAVAEYAPVYLPDLIVVGFFVNEFFDVTRSNEQYASSIGFDRRSQSGVYSVLRMVHTRRLIRRFVFDWAPAVAAGKPTSSARMFGNFNAFEIENRATLEGNAGLVEAHLASISDVAKDLGSQVLVVLVPASVQVRRPEDLAYITRGADPAASPSYDLDQPHEIAMGILQKLGLPYFDLRPVLCGPDCYYAPRNMHWTEEGHEVVARAVAEAIPVGALHE
ncbi:MAG: acyltransferase family protein [Spirochaetia bacterium]